MSSKTALIWFRQDLRLNDNPALIHAVQNGYDILPIYILDDENAGSWKQGGASRWWLHQSLTALNSSLSRKMQFYKGRAENILPKIILDHKIQAVFWNRCYEPWRTTQDKFIKDNLKHDGVEVKSFNATLLWEPWDILKNDGTPYKVFTPFYQRGCLGKPAPALPIPVQSEINFLSLPQQTTLDDLQLMPDIGWYKDMAKIWTPGETGAKKRLDIFLKEGLNGYKIGRNRPDFENVSRLSPHFHFGEISPRSVWHSARPYGLAHRLESDIDCF